MEFTKLLICPCYTHLPVIWLLYLRLIRSTKANVTKWHSYRSSCNVSVALGNPSAHSAGRFCCNSLEITWPMTLVRMKFRGPLGSKEFSLEAARKIGGDENGFRAC